MNRILAKVLSVVFHPLLMPTYLFFLILYYLPASVITFPVESRWLIMVLVFFTTFMVPATGAYIMLRSGHINSFEMADRRQRRLPLFFTSLCYAVTTYLLFRENMFDQLFFYVMALITLSVFLTYLITIFWKISAHAVGLGGGLGILLLLNTLLPDGPLLTPIIALILITGAVMSARLALRAHTSDEVYGGFLMGLSVGLGMWLTMP